MPSAAVRYAEALVMLAAEENAIDAYQEELAALSEIFLKKDELRNFLLDPGTDTGVKRNVVTGIFQGQIRQNLLHFLLLLLDKDRMAILPDICRDFIDLADEKRNIVKITIISSAELEQAQINEIGNRFKELLGCTAIKADVRVDTSLIGGVKVAVGDKIYDGSVKGRLSGLRTALSK